MEENTGIIASPDSLLDDNESMEFYLLRDESLAICKHRNELPYHKNRSTYLASGRFSPKHKKVIFWPDSVNPRRAFTLLCESEYIENDYDFLVSGVTTRISPVKPADPKMDKLSNIRRVEVKNLLEKGLRIQNNVDDQSQEDNL